MRAIRSSTHSVRAPRVLATASLAVLVLLAVACGGDAPPAAVSSDAASAQTQTATSLSPEQLGQLGAEIRRDPNRADEVLARHQLTRESFEQAIRTVTEDPDASRRYAAAYRGVSSSS